jgi:hypothetical protein
VSRNPVRHDTRKHARATLEVPVVVSHVADPAHRQIRFAVADVSGGGAFLRSDLLFEIGELLTIDFDLPGGRHVRVRGRVVRVSRTMVEPAAAAEASPVNGKPPSAQRAPRSSRDRHPGMGVEFLDLAPEDRAAIEERL